MSCIFEWHRFKNDIFPIRIDMTGIDDWIIFGDSKKQLCFVHKTENAKFLITKRNHKGLYKLYKNGKYLYSLNDALFLINEILGRL